jgi:hypothetical protein
MRQVQARTSKAQVNTKPARQPALKPVRQAGRRLLRTQPAPDRLNSADILTLQRTVGNRQVRDLLSSVQPALIQRDQETDDPLHQSMIDDYRRWRGLPPGGRDEFGQQVGPTDAQIKYGRRRDPPLTQADVEARLVGECLRLSNGVASLLSSDYVQAALAGRAQNADLLAAFNQAVQQVGQDTFDLQMGRIEREAPALMRLMETQFINDPNASSLDLLPPDQRQRYRTFNWQEHDYPGGTAGPNEGRAREMMRNLSRLRPERRVNQGENAVVTRPEFTAAMQRYILSELRPIPDFPAPAAGGQGPQQAAGQRLNQHALQDFLRMREAALQDGVAIVVRDSYRTPARAAANAARSGNPEAVASFSPHMLGLAIDLQMSFTATSSTGAPATPHRFSEATTTPMQNVVDMRTSPTHKWLFLHGAAYGWHPFQNEPWHWEYNPPGFRETFRQNFQP